MGRFKESTVDDARERHGKRFCATHSDVGVRNMPGKACGGNARRSTKLRKSRYKRLVGSRLRGAAFIH